MTKRSSGRFASAIPGTASMSCGTSSSSQVGAMMALVGISSRCSGERVVDIGCGCGAPTLALARAVGPSGRVSGYDISGPMLADGKRRASAAGLANVDWRHVDPAATLDEYHLLTSSFGTMFFGDRVAAFTNIRTATPDARMAIVCWRSIAENPWMEVPLSAVARHLPPRPTPAPNAGGGCRSVDRHRRREQLAAQPAGRGHFGRRSLRGALAPFTDGVTVRVPGTM